MFTLLFISFKVNSQTCDELISSVKSKAYGTTYTSYNSSAISKVTFYDIYEGSRFYYFAIVCFKKSYSGCAEYIYQVTSTTKTYYSMNYLESAGKAFWAYIQPYNKVLSCGANVDN